MAANSRGGESERGDDVAAQDRKFDVRLVAAAAHECVYAGHGQPPGCHEEWPGQPWKWCGACLAKAVTA